MIRSKLCGNYAFSQNFHTRKLGEITLFFAVVTINTYRVVSFNVVGISKVIEYFEQNKAHDNISMHLLKIYGDTICVTLEIIFK